MSEQTAPVADHSPTTETARWQDDPDYPHRIENHVKVYLHIEEVRTPLPVVADQDTAPAGTRVFRRKPDGRPEHATVRGWTTDGAAVFLDVDQGGTYAGPTFGSVFLAREDAASLRWAVSSVSVDGYPLDGVEDGNYCDYEGHPPGARPDWDRQHRVAERVPLPTAHELLPMLASALGHQVTKPDSDQFRDAAGLIAEHAAWRAARDQLSSREATDEAPSSSEWHDSDDTGCELADRAVALLAAMTEPAGTTPPPSTGTEAAGVGLMRSALVAPRTPTNTAHATPTPPTKGPAR